MALWNDYGISNWTILLISATVFLYLYVDRKFQYWKRRGVKSQTLWDWLKHMHNILTKPMQDSFLENYIKFGRIYGGFMGFTPHLSIADPTLLKQILVKDFQAFHNRVDMSMGEPLLDNMLTVMQDDDWKRVRCIISTTFTTSRMRKMAYLVKECAEKFSKYCEKTAEKNEEIDCKKYYIGFSIDIIGSTAFGTKINALENPNHPFVENARKLSSQDASGFIILFFLFQKLLKFFNSDIFFGDILKYFKGFATHVIEEREKNNIRENDFLQLMLDAQRGKLEPNEEDSKERTEDQYRPIQTLPDRKTMSFDELLAQCIVFFVAGGETTSTTLAFLSYYMALHPEYQERLIEEIDNTWRSHDEINFDVLNKMTYLDAVICEVLRIQPLAMQLMRIATEDYDLGDTGIKIEKGVPIIVPVYAMHRDPEFFPDPEKFDPERFMPDNRQSIPPYVYLPFGDGPRNCIGMRFATMVLKLCVVYLFRTVRVEATENTKKPLEFYKGQSLIQPKQVMVRLTKRNDIIS